MWTDRCEHSVLSITALDSEADDQRQASEETGSSEQNPNEREWTEQNRTLLIALPTPDDRRPPAILIPLVPASNSGRDPARRIAVPGSGRVLRWDDRCELRAAGQAPSVGGEFGFSGASPLDRAQRMGVKGRA